MYFWGVNSFTSKLISWFSIIFTLPFPGVLLHRKVFLWLLFYVPFAIFFYACRKHQSTYQYFNVHFQVKWSLAVIKNNKFISILVAATVYQVFFLIIPHTVAFFLIFRSEEVNLVWVKKIFGSKIWLWLSQIRRRNLRYLNWLIGVNATPMSHAKYF